MELSHYSHLKFLLRALFAWLKKWGNLRTVSNKLLMNELLELNDWDDTFAIKEFLDRKHGF